MLTNEVVGYNICNRVSTQVVRVLIAKKVVWQVIGERQSAILNLIIDSYIKTGEPIGSKTIAALLPYRISSATIRNEMAYLSELGYLEQLHTSAGRIPSKASFRYYVNNLVKPSPLSEFEKEKIKEYLSVNAGDPERLLHDGAKLLADITGCASFYCTVKDEYDCIQGVDLIPAGNGKAMLVMLTVGGKIKSSVCSLSCPIDNNFKSVFYNTMSLFFIGAPLTDINLGLIQSTVPFLKERAFDMLPVLTSLSALCREASDSTLVIEGNTNLLSHEEFGSDVYKLLSFLSSKKQFIKYLTEYSKIGSETALFIGDENYHYELKNTTTILAKYNYNESQTALLGIIGSTRIDYALILPRAEYIMKTIKEFLQKGGVTFE